MTLNNIYQTILIATDGSKFSQNTILQGVELAKLVGTKVYVLYVLDKSAYLCLRWKHQFIWVLTGMS